MDHLKAGGTLLNMKFTPSLVAAEAGIEQWAHLVRGYFKMDGHHVQFNVVRAGQLRAAQQHPEQHRDLIVRVAGFSDYFCDLAAELQEEIIARSRTRDFLAGVFRADRYSAVLSIGACLCLGSRIKRHDEGMD